MIALRCQENQVTRLRRTHVETVPACWPPCDVSGILRRYCSGKQFLDAAFRLYPTWFMAVRREIAWNMGECSEFWVASFECLERTP